MARCQVEFIVSQSVFCKVMFTLRETPYAGLLGHVRAFFFFTYALYVFTLANFTLLYYNVLLVTTII